MARRNHTIRCGTAMSPHAWTSHATDTRARAQAHPTDDTQKKKNTTVCDKRDQSAQRSNRSAHEKHASRTQSTPAPRTSPNPGTGISPATHTSKRSIHAVNHRTPDQQHVHGPGELVARTLSRARKRHSLLIQGPPPHARPLADGNSRRTCNWVGQQSDPPGLPW
jgi:hypothetical protein